jgi:hypothetical protein
MPERQSVRSKPGLTDGAGPAPASDDGQDAKKQPERGAQTGPVYQARDVFREDASSGERIDDGPQVCRDEQVRRGAEQNDVRCEKTQAKRSRQTPAPTFANDCANTLCNEED